jgi:hypothetical protein
MADILLDGLPVLDLLEITPSTSVVARITQRDQSSISRIYRQVSQRLSLDFRKHDNGFYSAGANQSLLEGLRFSSQWLRLQSEPAEPRWLACGSLTAMPGVPYTALPQTLVGRCDNLQHLLRTRVLDLAVIHRASDAEPPSPPASGRTPLQELPLIRSPKGDDLLLLRADLTGQPVIQRLIATISRAYRQHQQRHPSLAWLG